MGEQKLQVDCKRTICKKSRSCKEQLQLKCNIENKADGVSDGEQCSPSYTSWEHSLSCIDCMYKVYDIAVAESQLWHICFIIELVIMMCEQLVVEFCVRLRGCIRYIVQIH